MQLTTEQQRSIESGQPVETTVGGVTCVVVRKEVYDRISRLVYDDSDMTHDDMMALLAQSAEANGWNEPGMEDYDRYDELKNEKK